MGVGYPVFWNQSALTIGGSSLELFEQKREQRRISPLVWASTHCGFGTLHCVNNRVRRRKTLCSPHDFSVSLIERRALIKFVLRRERYWPSKLDSLLPRTAPPAGSKLPKKVTDSVDPQLGRC